MNILAATCCALLAGTALAGCSDTPSLVPFLAAGSSATYDVTGYPLGLISPGLSDLLDQDGSDLWPAPHQVRVYIGSPLPVIGSTGAIHEQAFPVRFQVDRGHGWDLGMVQWLGPDGAVVAMQEPVIVRHDNGTRSNTWGYAFSDGRPDLLNLGFFPGRTARGILRQHVHLPEWMPDERAHRVASKPLSWQASVQANELGDQLRFSLKDVARLERGRIDTWTLTFDRTCPFPSRVQVSAPDLVVLDMRRVECMPGSGVKLGNQAQTRTIWNQPSPFLAPMGTDQLPPGGADLVTTDEGRLGDAWSKVQATQEYRDSCPCRLVGLLTSKQPDRTLPDPLPPILPEQRHWTFALLHPEGLLILDVAGDQATRLDAWPEGELDAAALAAPLQGLDLRVVHGLAAHVQGPEAWSWYALPTSHGPTSAGRLNYAVLTAPNTVGGVSWTVERRGNLSDGTGTFSFDCLACFEAD